MKINEKSYKVNNKYVRYNSNNQKGKDIKIVYIHREKEREKVYFCVCIFARARKRKRKKESLHGEIKVCSERIKIKSTEGKRRPLAQSNVTMAGAGPRSL